MQVVSPIRVIAGVALLFLGTVPVASAQHRISQLEAKKIVREALISTHKNFPSLSIEASKQLPASDFYTFAATWPNPDGSPIVGYYAVNPYTGSVWDSVMMEPITSKLLSKHQLAIRLRLRVSARKYDQLQASEP